MLVTGGTTQPVVKVFTSAGKVLGAFVWDKGRILGFAWTAELELVIVEATGEVRALLCCWENANASLAQLCNLI